MKTEINNLLPLTEATFFILLSLSPGPKHGYAIMKAVHQMSDSRITFSTGTLYGALKRLLDQGWILRSGEGGEAEDETSRTRKEYELTALGSRVLDAEVARIHSLFQLAASIRPVES